MSIEHLNRFVLYVIPETCAAGKDVNSVLSLLDHCLKNFLVGEQCIMLHADNYIGQNKNNYTLQMLALQVVRKRYKAARISFLPVGHIKFRPDSHFERSSHNEIVAKSTLSERCLSDCCADEINNGGTCRIGEWRHVCTPV